MWLIYLISKYSPSEKYDQEVDDECDETDFEVQDIISSNKVSARKDNVTKHPSAESSSKGN